MSEVLDKIKEKYPQYRDVPDDQLTLKIAEKYPQYLDKDPTFKAEYQSAVATGIQAGVSAGADALNQLTRTLTNPAAGAAAQMGRDETQAANDPPREVLRPPTLAEKTLGLAERLGIRTQFEREQTRVGPTEVKPFDFKPKDIVEAARQFTASSLGVSADKLAQTPTDESVAKAMSESRALSTEIGMVQGLEDIDNFLVSPAGIATIGTGALPKLAQRLVALGFSAQMAKQTPEIAKQLGDEFGKPEDQRDYQKIGNLVTQAATTVGFSVAGVLHGVKPGIGEEIKTAADRVRSIAPKTAEALDQTGKEANAIQRETTEVLQPVQPQPGEGKGEVSAKGTSAEAGARSQPAAPEEKQGVRVKPQDLRPAIETPAGNLIGEYGDSHADVLERAGLDPDEIDHFHPSRGFVDINNPGVFLNRDEAQEASGITGTAEAGGLDSQDLPGAARVKLERQAGMPPVIQAGAAHVLEVPETGAGGEKYGIAQRLREERAKAGQVGPVQPGQGISRETAIARSRQLADQGPAFLEQFETTGLTSPDTVLATRGWGEKLAANARQIESRFGTDSDEYRAAKKALTDWDERTKPLATEAHKQFMAHQGETDLDTGSITGLSRERIRLSGKDFTPEEEKQAGQLAADVTKAETTTTEDAKAVNTELENNATPERQLAETERQISEAVNTRNESAEQVAAARRAQDAAWKVIRESAVRAADAETKARVAQAKRDVDVARIQEKAAAKAQAQVDKVIRRLAAQSEKQKAVVRERAKLDEQLKAAQNAQQAALKTVREAAARAAEAENKARVATAENDRKVADVQKKAAQRAQDAAWKTVREAAQRAAALERKILANPEIPVWNKAKEYLDRDIVQFDDLRNKIASDLGMPVDKVTKLLARSKRMKFLTDKLWLSQARERNLKTKAKLWVQGLDVPAYEKFIKSLPRKLFAIRVGLHGTVALGTHAPAVAFDPRFWGTYIKNFGKMYHMVLSPSFYEGQMQDLIRRKNYATALRGGLVVDPFKHEDFKYPGFTPDMVDKLQKAMADATGLDVKSFFQTGTRGYSVLKSLRMDLFDQHWDNLPRQLQTSEMAGAIADAVNHITGVVKSPLFPGAELLAFAPKLQVSRGAFLFADPLRALKTGTRLAVRGAGQAVGVRGAKLPYVSAAARWFAANEVKSKVYMLGTLGGLLAVNQGILAASGSKQRVNMTNPYKSDFAKFKVAGLNVSYGNPLITMLRLPIRIGGLALSPGGKMRKLIYPDEDAARLTWDYFRSQMSPASALASDLIFREDYQNRQLPNSQRPEPKRLMAQGTEPYTWPEYFWTQTALPIPFQEMVRETWKTGFGVSEEQRQAELKALGGLLFNMGTGGRVSKDYEVGTE